MVGRGWGAGGGEYKNDGLREVNHSISGRIIKGHIDVGIHLRHLHRNRRKIIFKILIDLNFR